MKNMSWIKMEACKVRIAINAFKLCILLLALQVAAGISHSAVTPVFERLNPISANLNAPTDVALDQNGNIYVAESVKNRVAMYKHSGSYIDALTGLAKPISIAVDSNFRVYVGNKDTGNVQVYDSGLNELFQLGGGANEFGQPGSIAIDSAGKIYVADSDTDEIKIYNSDGSYDTKFGVSGSGDGFFNFPTSIAIDEAAEELIITDLQLMVDPYGGRLEQTRVHVYDKNSGYAYKRSFGDYGVGDGKIAKVMGAAVDGVGRVYVADSVQHVVHVYDSVSGGFLGTIFDLTNPLRNPLGIAIGDGNRLYIASLSTSQVEVYGIDQYQQMVVSPLSLSFSAQGGDDPDAQMVQTTNNGTATLNWTASTEASWITISDEAGTALPGDTSATNIDVNMDGLSAGTYNGTVYISAETGETETVSVVLTLLPTPRLSVIPGTLEYTSENGSVPVSKSLSIMNIGSGTMNWSATKDAAWIMLSKTSGSAPDSMDVSVDISGKSLGTYTGTITVSGEGSLSSPAEITVTLNIVQHTGTINVTANIAEASYTINGPESYTGNGMSWTRFEVPTGTYAIIYGAVEGYDTPLAQNGMRGEDGTLIFTAEYTSATPDILTINRNIIAGAGPDSVNTGIVKVFKSDGTATAVEFLAHEYGYGVNVAAGDINNDGVDEIITAPGPGENNPADINVFDASGNKINNLSIAAANGYNYGATVASGDLNGDGYDEVVVGAGAGALNPSEVKVFMYDSYGDQLVDSGIGLTAYATGYGVVVAIGDIDCDDNAEIITAPGPGAANDGDIKVWTVDSTQGVGQWSVTLMQEYTVTSMYGYSVNIGAGDMDGDSYSEVITGTGPYISAGDKIKVYDRYGDKISEFMANIVSGHGATVAAGDLDKDGVAEIVVGAGAGPSNPAEVKVFDVNGVEQAWFEALTTMYGVNVAVGDLGLE
jgi:hypothetical protein